MADHPQSWGDRTAAVPPQDPWAHLPDPEPTPAPVSTPAFQRGVAHVKPAAPRTQTMPVAAHEPTGTGWPGGTGAQPRRSVGWHLDQLRRGGGWSVAGALFAFVCWGVWTLASGGDLTTPILVFVLSLAVAAGVFGLARVVGQVVLERQLGRVRRSARGAHLVTALFLGCVGVAYLQQTPWVMSAWNWAIGLF
ncbi:MAG TPA: hypothetical protein VF755_30365 [Catenuloplanes sp.]|jgi:hypothetical protein